MSPVTRKIIIGLISVSLFLLPVFGLVFAADDGGLVPCGKGEKGPEDCTLEMLLILFNKVSEYAMWVASLIASAMIIYAGGTMIYNAGTNPGKAAGAKKILYNVIIGYFIVMISWLLVKSLVTFFSGDSGPLFEAINKIFKK